MSIDGQGVKITVGNFGAFVALRASYVVYLQIVKCEM